MHDHRNVQCSPNHRRVFACDSWTQFRPRMGRINCLDCCLVHCRHRGCGRFLSAHRRCCKGKASLHGPVREHRHLLLGLRSPRPVGAVEHGLNRRVELFDRSGARLVDCRRRRRLRRCCDGNRCRRRGGSGEDRRRSFRRPHRRRSIRHRLGRCPGAYDPRRRGLPGPAE